MKFFILFIVGLLVLVLSAIIMLYSLLFSTWWLFWFSALFMVMSGLIFHIANEFKLEFKKC
jgi:asparagine N-glycosylation enzyme membrane subunit Stt3